MSEWSNETINRNYGEGIWEVIKNINWLTNKINKEIKLKFKMICGKCIKLSKIGDKIRG